MDPTQGSLNIDWHSDENHVLLNPRLSESDLRSLNAVAKEGLQKMNLRGHIWLATSGSTSESMAYVKLVAQSKKSFIASAQAVNKHLGTTAHDVWLQVLPRFHVGGLGIEARAKLSGSKVVSDFEKWHPERAHKFIEDHSVTIASMVPTQVFDLIQAKLKAPKKLRAVIVGGGAMTESLYSKAKALGWPLLPSYGMTETCSQIATATLESLSEESLPLPKRLEHAEWRLSSEGLLQVRGPSLLTCYGQRQKDDSVRIWDPKVDSWFTSEDHAELQGDFIRVTGRKNDFIKIGGEGSSMGRLREIFERVLGQTMESANQQAFLVDAPSARLGTEIHLVLISKPNSELSSQLMNKFNQEVLPFERIREVKYIESVPRSDLGKVLWAQLKRNLYGS